MRTVGAGGAALEWFRQNFCRELSKEAFYEKYLGNVLKGTRIPEARFHPFLSGDRHRIRRKSAAFTRLTLNTNREDVLPALLHGIVQFQTESLSDWDKKVSLSKKIFHVGGGASDAYSRYKQSLFTGYNFVNLGETTLTGSARIAMDALK